MTLLCHEEVACQQLMICFVFLLLVCLVTKIMVTQEKVGTHHESISSADL